jgi:hypothetical protein
MFSLRSLSSRCRVVSSYTAAYARMRRHKGHRHMHACTHARTRARTHHHCDDHTSLGLLHVLVRTHRHQRPVVSCVCPLPSAPGRARWRAPTHGRCTHRRPGCPWAVAPGSSAWPRAPGKSERPPLRAPAPAPPTPPTARQQHGSWLRPRVLITRAPRATTWRTSTFSPLPRFHTLPWALLATMGFDEDFDGAIGIDLGYVV